MQLEQLGCTEIVDLLTEISPGVKALRDSFAGSPPYAPSLVDTYNITDFDQHPRNDRGRGEGHMRPRNPQQLPHTIPVAGNT